MATSKLQQAIDVINSRQLPLGELRHYLFHASPLVRANAIVVVAEHIQEDGPLLNEVVGFAKNPDHSFRLMGATSVGHMAVLGLLRSRCDAARRAGLELVKSWPEADRQDLVWFLESEGVGPVDVES